MCSTINKMACYGHGIILAAADVRVVGLAGGRGGGVGWARQRRFISGSSLMQQCAGEIVRFLFLA
jgi:hypothetical protein